ncbi:hypothetical protein DL96DRAFT_984378 [Flagelloscypha sp. PMI_526]|nr:hypothetical protein DL96DRAFT_984378 [Flagelloscypha sp. PMI_526]
MSWLDPSSEHTGFQNFIDGVTKSAYTIAISISSVMFGKYLGSQATPYVHAIRPPLVSRYVLSILSILCFFATIPIYVLLPPRYRHEATAALLFAFPGTLCRYFLSIKLNPTKPSFPLGTFVANSAGTALLGAFHVLQGTHVNPRTCGLLQGLEDGLCGCLTTCQYICSGVAYPPPSPCCDICFRKLVRLGKGYC